MHAPGCGRLALPLLLVTVAALAEGDARRLQEGETPGNFMEDEQWLSSISQYSGKIKHWNRFRDVSLRGREGRGLGMGVWGGSFGAETLGPGVAAARRSHRLPQPSQLIAPRVNNEHPPGS